ncbi:GNAT family N-acetyltransferase [Burkholderia pseudomallei]
MRAARRRKPSWPSTPRERPRSRSSARRPTNRPRSCCTEGHPAGMIGAYFDGTPARRAFVSELWVAHAVRHLRGGVLLVNTARAWLATRGAGEIYAWIADQNRSAIRFYEHVGFADTGERAPITRVPGAMKSLFVWREHA